MVRVENGGGASTYIEETYSICGLKVGRAKVSIPALRGGKIKIPRGMPWYESFVAECCSFPRARHDDRVDAFTHFVSYMLDFAEVESVIPILGYGR